MIMMMIMVIKLLYWLLATGSLILLSLGISEDAASIMVYGHRNGGALVAVCIGSGLFVGICMAFIHRLVIRRKL